MSNQKYEDLFPKEKRSEAFKVALDVRKFEIELYWKRATYFWAFIAATFIGYNAVQNSPDKDFLKYLLSGLGLVLSFGWFLANRGSKKWQENWEHHVDHLENDVVGPLFKVTLPRKSPEGVLGWLEFVTVGPSGHSVSKINQMLSLYMFLIWGALYFRCVPSGHMCSWSGTELFVFVITAGSCIGLLFGTRTYLGEHTHRLNIRDSNIE
jgi:hypothetical protein